MSESYKIAQVAERFNCSERMVLQLIYDGKLEAFKVGNRYRIPEEAVQKYIADNTAKGDCNNGN